jgi:hypothetical protein
MEADIPFPSPFLKRAAVRQTQRNVIAAVHDGRPDLARLACTYA